MNLPGFTAEASLYKTYKYYMAMAQWGDGRGRHVGPAQGSCRTCCGRCTGASLFPPRRSCAPECTAPNGSTAPVSCGLRFPFYRACTTICDGLRPEFFTRACLSDGPDNVGPRLCSRETQPCTRIPCCSGLRCSFDGICIGRDVVAF